MSLRGRRLAATLSASVIVLAATAVRAESLADAIALAYQSNPTLLAAQATQRALDENYVQARTGWRPTLNATVQATYQEERYPKIANKNLAFGAPDIQQSNFGEAGLTFTQPIWTGGRTAAAVSAAQADILSGRENLRRVEAQVLATVIQAYMDVRRDEQALAIRQADLKVLQSQLDETKARFDVGELTRTDVAEAQARLASSQASLQSAQAQLAVSRAEYAAAVGQNPGELAPPPSLAYMLPADADAAFDVAEKFNPTLRAQQYAADASHARIVQAKAGFAPRVSVQANLNTIGPADRYDERMYHREVIATAGISVPLFAGGLTTSQVRQEVERNNTDRINVEVQHRALLQTVTQSWNLLLANRANVESSKEAVNAAMVAAEGTRQEQQVGLRTTIDVLNAEEELRAAQLSQISAEHDEYLYAVNLLSAMGRLEARNLIPTVPRYDPKRNFNKLRITWGWVPWEEPIAVVDSVLTPKQHEKPVEPTIGPGLEAPAPTPTSAVTPPAK